MKLFFTLLILFLFSTYIYSQQRTNLEKFKQEQQETFERRKQQSQTDFEKYKQNNQEKFKNYRDSINTIFASFMEKEWKRFDLQNPEPLIKKPIYIPPVYKITVPEPDENSSLPKEPVIAVEPIKPIPEPEPTSISKEVINTTFFGTTIKFRCISVSVNHLSGINEKSIAQYWKSLINIPYIDLINEAEQIKNELMLNDWGLYQLLNKMFQVYLPNGTTNEQVIFTVFMLNQMEYKAKIGKENQELFSLIAFKNEVTNCTYFHDGNNTSTKYYLLNPGHKELSSITTCSIDYMDAVNKMNLDITHVPLLASLPVEKSLSFYGKTYRLTYNQCIVDFYKDYPCVEFSLYAEAPLDKTFSQSIDRQIYPHIAGKSQEEAVNWLLHFVQNAFDYKTDEEQFGYEKWNFAEETIASDYSDCEDRSILFAQLVRRLLKMPVVLIYYPGIHLATAVKFKNPNTTGDYVQVDGSTYLICDPTYIHANLGMGMPDLRNTPVKIFKLR